MKLIGKKFEGGFRILHEIARGAFAQVYLASNGTEVKAVKVFPQAYRRHAEREYAYGSKLNHPYVNTIEALVEVDGYLGVLMPYLQGQRLSSYFDKPQVLQFLKSFSELLIAIGHVHEKGIIHRDIKPDNVMVSRAGHVKLFDFDLAVRIDEPQRKRAVIGTVAYLSPEQAKGEAVNKASDLYSAGVILYRGLSGEVPFTGTIQEVLSAHQEEKPRAISSLVKDLSLFDDLLERLLAKKPTERYGSADEVGQMLEQLRDQLRKHLV
jgi:serine/threonine protein kinase